MSQRIEKFLAPMHAMARMSSIPVNIVKAAAVRTVAAGQTT